MIPRFLHALPLENSEPGREKIVVIIQLSGGNDGLNTIIPVRNDIYYRMRPSVAIKTTEALPLTDEAGIHPSLSFFRQLFHNGELAILNGVGYPNPDRSHFRSMDIWHTASDSQQLWQTGWLGRYLDEACRHCDHPAQVLELDDLLSLALKGAHMNGIAAKNPALLYGNTRQPFLEKLIDHPHDHEPVAAYLYKTLASTMQSADYLFRESKRHPSGATYPNTDLGKALHTIAGLAMSQINTRVYYLSHGSFDTHINQQAQQNRLFTELNDAVAAFTNDLKKQGRFKDLLLFTFSEFGRRVKQNASGGTDHGTANNMFFIGGSLRQQGLVNALPALDTLDNNDLMYSVDFRQVYHMVLQRWLQMAPEKILGQEFPGLNIV